MSEARAGRVCDVALVVLACALPLSIAVSEITLGVVLVAWLGTRPWRRTPATAWRLVALASGGLVAAWLLASATAGDPLASLVKARKLWSLALLLVVADRARAARLGDRLSLAALLAGAVSAAFGVAALVAVRLAAAVGGQRLEGVFSTAMTSGNVFATLLVAGLGEILARPLSGVRRAAGVLVVVGLAVTLLATQTRSAWLAVLAGTGFLLVQRKPRLLLVLAALVVAIVTLGPAELRERAVSVVDPAHPGNAGRISLWKSGVAVLADRPWTGVGLADHYDLIERYRRPDATFHAGHFHNNLVQVAVSTGLIGLVAYLAWMGVLGGLLLRGAARGGGGRVLVGLAVWVAFQVHGMFDWSFGDAEVANQFFLWTGLGLGALDPLPGAGIPGLSATPDPPAVRALSGPPPTA